MSDGTTLKHPTLNRRRTFRPHQQHLLERYIAAGWRPEEVASVEPAWVEHTPFDSESDSNSGIWEVPEGSIPVVLDWVSNDPERARTALWVERETSRRASLIARLEQIAHEPQDGEKETDI